MSKLKLEYDWLLNYVRIIKQMTHNINTSTTSTTKYSFQRRDEDYFNFSKRNQVDNSQERFKTLLESKTELIANFFFVTTRKAL